MRGSSSTTRICIDRHLPTGNRSPYHHSICALRVIAPPTGHPNRSTAILGAPDAAHEREDGERTEHPDHDGAKEGGWSCAEQECPAPAAEQSAKDADPHDPERPSGCASRRERAREPA